MAAVPASVSMAGPFARARRRTLVPVLGWLLMVLAVGARAEPSTGADTRAAALVARMTDAEKMQLVLSYSTGENPTKAFHPPAGAVPGSAGFTPGIPRLRIPPMLATDSGVGVSGIGPAAEARGRTALPSNMAIAATWDPGLARLGGTMIGREARASGYNVMLSGSMVLVREPRSGRAFENGGEDPLLNGVMTGTTIAGIQSNQIVATLKHYAMNAQESGRKAGDALIDPAAARVSDLLATQIALEHGRPGAVMCAYNKVNGVYSCENPWLLDRLLKRDWQFKGFVMSDWGAVHSTAAAANAGLDQQSGWPFDDRPYFGAPLMAAIAAGEVPRRRLDDMARRIVRAVIAAGAVDHPASPGLPIDFARDEAVARRLAAAAIVVLKNDRDVLPLVGGTGTVAVIGGHADKGVLSGGGSAQVHPRGGNAVPGLAPVGWPGPVIYLPDPPLRALRAAAPGTRFTYDDGSDPAAAAAAAAQSDIALVFVTRWTSEAQDFALGLPDGQDALVAAVAATNPRTIVVVESGGPVLMPWAAKVAGIVQAWYPGSGGGRAIADILLGTINPSGRLPVSFPASVDQLPRPAVDGFGQGEQAAVTMNYREGAAVGYKWYDRQRLTPLFPFGHGLSYTSFRYGGLTGAAGGAIRLEARVSNVGKRAGAEVVQFYAAPPGGGWEAPKRLVGWRKIMLRPGESRRVHVTVDPRLLATWNVAANRWSIAGGRYRIMAGGSSAVLPLTSSLTVASRTLPADYAGPGALPNK